MPSVAIVNALAVVKIMESTLKNKLLTPPERNLRKRKMKTTIQQTNYRTKVAIICARIGGRNPATIGEIRDALNQRRTMRQTHLLSKEQTELRCRYLRENAPDLIPYFLKGEQR